MLAEMQSTVLVPINHSKIEVQFVSLSIVGLGRSSFAFV